MTRGGTCSGSRDAFNWQKSKAHWLLLSKFIHPHSRDEYTTSEAWKEVLGEQPAQALNRFAQQGLIANAEIFDLVSYKYKVPELKELLRQHSLAVSGLKGEMVQRLVQADKSGMTAATAGLTVLVSTAEGRKLAEQYLLDETQKRTRAEQTALQYITNRKFREAGLAVAAFEKEQVFSRGIGMDWQHYEPAHAAAMLASVFSIQPAIISKVNSEKMDYLRQGAAMMMLWGTNSAHKWLPPGFETGISLNVDTASRMLFFAAAYRKQIDDYRMSGVVANVEIRSMPDSCAACKQLDGKRYPLATMPELPYEHCTHQMGCRCMISPVVDL